MKTLGYLSLIIVFSLTLLTGYVLRMFYEDFYRDENCNGPFVIIEIKKDPFSHVLDYNYLDSCGNKRSGFSMRVYRVGDTIK